MWDYKVGFCNPKAVIAEESLLLCELLHDIAALYNAFGGYLVIAFTDEQANHFRKLTNKDDFDKLTDRYLKTYVPTATYQTKANVDGVRANVLLIHVGKRTVGPPIAYKRNAAQDAQGRGSFKTEDIPFRYGTSTQIINQRHDLLVFAFGERKPDVGEIPTPLNEIDNNLPPRDPNLIEFIGRREYLVTLWNWLADARNPVKVLTALGGAGKTAIAYEFCEQIVRARSEVFAKVIWLTAKSRTFAAILHSYVSTTRTDFTDIDSFLDAFLREIGCQDSDFVDFENLDDKLDLAKEMIRDIPILLVIDDLDSLDRDKQRELYSRIAQLFDQAMAAQRPSRVLFTSRLEPSAGPNRILTIQGFSSKEGLEYLKSMVSHLNGGSSWGSQALAWSDAIYTAAKGSPIFMASILRLLTFGEDLEAVLQHWSGKDGEEVRRFAFKREIDSLGYPQWRVLYVLQLLSSTSFEELMEITGEDRTSLQASLSEINQFHLFATGGNPATGAELSVPEPVRLMVKITEDNLNAADAEELRKRCARVVSRAGDGQSEISKRIRGIKLLWHRKRFTEALTEAARTAKDFPSRGEASFILGRTHLYQTPPNYIAADEAFKEANLKRYSEANLLEYWALARLKRGDVTGLLKITNSFLAPNLSGVPLLYRLAGLYRVATDREGQKDYAAAFRSYQMLFNESTSALASDRTAPVTANVRRLASAVPDYVVDVAYKSFKRDNIDRILDFAARAAAEGFPPLQTIDRISRDCSQITKTERRSHPQVLRKRVDDLFAIARELSKLVGGGHPLCQHVLRAAREIQDFSRR